MLKISNKLIFGSVSLILMIGQVVAMTDFKKNTNMLEDSQNKINIKVTDVCLDNDGLAYGKINGELKVFTGQGRYIEQDYTYKGEFLNGKMHGQGIIVLKNKPLKNRGNYEENLFEGSFENNMLNGEGKFILANGSLLCGTWRNNVPDDVTFTNENKQLIHKWKNGKVIQ